VAQNQKKKEKQDETTPEWYYKDAKWKPSEDEITKFLQSLSDKNGTKLMRYVIFENLIDEKWACRQCVAEELAKEGLPSGQYAGGGGIQGLERGQKRLRPGCELESGKEQCNKHGQTDHDRWTGFFKPNFSPSSIPPKLQEKIFEMSGYRDVIENRTREQGGLMVDHKFPRGEFNAPDDIPYGEILKNLESNDKAKVKIGQDQCKKYFQVLKKDDVGNHNKMKAEFCGTCCTCPACESELSNHSDDELKKCSTLPAKRPEKRYGKRGTVMGINFYYGGTTAEWPKGVPRKGLGAEKGCVGCGWYDVAKWREEFNKNQKKNTV